MTDRQINYFKALEEERSNRAKEQLDTYKFEQGYIQDVILELLKQEGKMNESMAKSLGPFGSIIGSIANTGNMAGLLAAGAQRSGNRQTYAPMINQYYEDGLGTNSAPSLRSYATGRRGSSLSSKSNTPASITLGGNY